MAETTTGVTTTATQPSGRYVTVGRGAAAYRAFVPAPLPPAMAYDAELVRALSAADHALGELAGFMRRDFGFRLKSWFADREVIFSARIEGADVDLRDLHADAHDLFPLPDLRPRPSHDALKQIANARAAVDAESELLNTLPISLRLIREIHARLCAGIREEQTTPGEFRRSQNWIGPAGALLSEATYVPPPPAELPAALDAFERYLHLDDGNPPLIRLAFIHQHFEAIHPFLDGNGRIGRRLIPLLLRTWGLLPDEVLTLSVYFQRNQQEYYRLLLAVNDEGVWREWLLFFLNGIVEASRDVLDRAQRLVALHEQWISWANTPRKNQSLTSFVDMNFLIPINAGKHLGNWHGYAERLASAGFLQVLPDPERKNIYVAREIFRIMDE